MTDVALTHIQYWCRPRSHALISPILVTFEQSGHTQGSVCCLRSSVTRWNHYESHMLLLVFLTGAPPAHTHTHTHCSETFKPKSTKVFLSLCPKKKQKKEKERNQLSPTVLDFVDYIFESPGEKTKRETNIMEGLQPSWRPLWDCLSQ